MTTDGRGDRTGELATALAAVRERIARAERAAGRRPGSVTLVVVTKDHPADDIRRLVDLGVTDVGESRQQQLRDKRADLGPELASRVRWHAIGRLQRNKARSVGELADVVHSVDDPRLVPLLAAGSSAVRDRLDCLVQVDLDLPPDPERGGADPAGVGPLADLVATTPGLALRGLMAVAPLGEDPGAAFARLAGLGDGVRARHPGATWLSAGMSGDLEPAIACGATHVRVGTAVLGSRPVAR